MSEYIDKKSLLAWLEKKAIETQSWVEQVLLRNLVSEEIKAGTFDVHIGDGIGAETLEEIGKRVAEIRAEAAEKERDELRKRVEELELGIKRAHLSLTWSTTVSQIPHAVWHLEQVVKELANGTTLDVNQYLGKRDTL